MTILFSTERIDAYTAQPEDVDRIIEIESHPQNRDFIWHNTKEEHLALIRSEGVYSLVFRKKGQDEIFGYLILEHKSKVGSLEFRRLALMDKSMGYGREIIQGIQKLAFTQLQVHRLWLDVYTFNLRAINTYEKQNFKREGTLRDAYKDHRGYLSQHVYSMLDDEYAQK